MSILSIIFCTHIVPFGFSIFDNGTYCAKLLQEVRKWISQSDSSFLEKKEA